MTTIVQYMDNVISLFKSGQATDLEYEQMAMAVLNASEGDADTYALDEVCDPIGWRSGYYEE